VGIQRHRWSRRRLRVAGRVRVVLSLLSTDARLRASQHNDTWQMAATASPWYLIGVAVLAGASEELWRAFCLTTLSEQGTAWAVGVTCVAFANGHANVSGTHLLIGVVWPSHGMDLHQRAIRSCACKRACLR